MCCRRNHNFDQGLKGLYHNMHRSNYLRFLFWDEIFRIHFDRCTETIRELEEFDLSLHRQDSIRCSHPSPTMRDLCNGLSVRRQLPQSIKSKQTETKVYI